MGLGRRTNQNKLLSPKDFSLLLPNPFASPTAKTPPLTIPMKVDRGEFSFHLNESVVNRIQQLQKYHYPLPIPSRKLLQLGYYAYLEGGLQSGLTFYAHYANSEGLDQIILRSIVSLDGDVINQIRRDLIQQRNCLVILSAYYWLTHQILEHLRHLANEIAWSLSGLITTYLLTIQIERFVLEVFQYSSLSSIWYGINGFVVILLWLLSERKRSLLFENFKFYTQSLSLHFLFNGKVSWLNYLALVLTIVILISAFSNEGLLGVALSLSLIPFLKRSLRQIILPFIGHSFFRLIYSSRNFRSFFEWLLM